MASWLIVTALLAAGGGLGAAPEAGDAASPAAAAEAAEGGLAELLALHRERAAIPFILEDIGFGGDSKLAQAIRERRDAVRDRLKELEARAVREAAEPDGARRLIEFLKPLEGMDLAAFREVCEGAARSKTKWPAETAAAFDTALGRIREARAKFSLKESQLPYVAVVRAELKGRDLYRNIPEPKTAGNGAKTAARAKDAPWTPPSFTAQWSNPVERWGGPERGAGGPKAHAFLMDELISDKGRALYEKLAGRPVVRPARADIIKVIRAEVVRQAGPELLGDTGVALERFQDVAVGLSQCESGVNQFYGKGREFEGQSVEGWPVVYLKPDAIAWANVVGCMQISCFWWCRSLEEGVYLAWDYRYNVYKGVGEMVKYFGQFKKQGFRGDELLAKMANRYSNGDWERMQKYLAEPEKWLR